MDDCQVTLKKVVACLDLSRYSETTFAHALTLARALDAELVLLNVINTRGLESLDFVAGQGFGVSREDYIAKTKAYRQDILGKEYLTLAGDTPVKLEFLTGLPFEEILRYLRKQGGDMVVMGTKGRSDLHGVLFGSTAEKVYRHSPCAVVSVRGPEHCRLPD